MAHGFQARLDEMLQSRRVQLHRLSEETQQQERKRALLQERNAALRKIQQNVLLLKQKIGRSSLDIALVEDEVLEQRSRMEQLAIRQRDAKKEALALEDDIKKRDVYKAEMSVMEDFGRKTQAYTSGALEERKALQDSVYEMELVLKALQDEGAALLSKRDELEARKNKLAEEVAANLSVKRLAEAELQDWCSEEEFKG